MCRRCSSARLPKSKEVRTHEILYPVSRSAKQTGQKPHPNSPSAASRFPGEKPTRISIISNASAVHLPILLSCNGRRTGPPDALEGLLCGIRLDFRCVAGDDGSFADGARIAEGAKRGKAVLKRTVLGVELNGYAWKRQATEKRPGWLEASPERIGAEGGT